MTIAWDSNELITQYNNLSSGHFFDKDTMRFFKSRVTENYRRLNDTEALFITTEKGPSGKRLATIRHAVLKDYIREPDGRKCYKISIQTLGDFNQITLAQAKREMQKIKG